MERHDPRIQASTLGPRLGMIKPFLRTSLVGGDDTLVVANDGGVTRLLASPARTADLLETTGAGTALGWILCRHFVFGIEQRVATACLALKPQDPASACRPPWLIWCGYAGRWCTSIPDSTTWVLR